MLAPITYDELVDLLVSQCPSATIEELSRASKAVFLILKASATGPPALAKPAPKKARQYKEKPLAESLKLKR